MIATRGALVLIAPLLMLASCQLLQQSEMIKGGWTASIMAVEGGGAQLIDLLGDVVDEYEY